MDRLAAMGAYARVVEHRSFTKAAEAMEVSRASLTRQVQFLEEMLGVTLLERTTRALALTPEGEAYYEGVVRFLSGLRQLETGARQTLRHLSGRVRVEVPPGIASALLMPALPSFCEVYPDVEVELLVRNRSVDLIAEGIDCALRIGTIMEQQLVARQLGQFRLRTCAAPAHLASVGLPESPAALRAGYGLIGLASSQSTRIFPWTFERDGQRVEISTPWRLIVSDARAAVEAAVAGLGVVQLPDYLVNPAIARGSLVEVLPDWRAPKVPIHVVYPPNRFLGTKVRVFIDWAALVLGGSRPEAVLRPASSKGAQAVLA